MKLPVNRYLDGRRYRIECGDERTQKRTRQQLYHAARVKKVTLWSRASDDKTVLEVQVIR